MALKIHRRLVFIEICGLEGISMIGQGRVREAIQDIVAKIVAEFSPQKVILFGSYAHGEPRRDSDLDFLVISDAPLPPREIETRIRQVIGSVEVPVDVFVMTPTEFEETKDVIGGLAYAPAKYGKVVYENPGNGF